MLQDLDARGGAGAAHAPELKAAPPAERHRQPLVLACGGAALLALAAGGWYGWQYWQGHGVAAGPAPVSTPVSAPKLAGQHVSGQPPLQQPNAIAASPESAVAAPHAADSAVAAPHAANSAVAAPHAADYASASRASAAAASASPAPALAPAASSSASAAAHSPAASAPVTAPLPATSAPAAASDVAARHEPASAGAPERDARMNLPAMPGAKRAARSAAAESDTPDQPAPAPARSRKSAAPAASANGAVNDLTPKQMAENTYRRGLTSLQEGRVSNALTDLEKAVEIDPRNDAARQTYVSLLLENKRSDDAIRQLRLALGIDPRQPSLAMVLARLQLEKGGPALQTLLTTLPYAGNNAEYHGFLAGVLQREQRHTEAVQHYRDALRLSPGNGVWWMGLGISLQAGQHLPEARDAYTRARAANGLTPELQAFIDRKLEQLPR
ncbi:tetratricopeptide repeat protein [Duganella sp. SAP-35]|uniref:Tetratricopeptide repeat protein n=2 Tax=Duganella aceris TaxID=2703883 RepID=A0ABX0FJ88_9BURK|nr:tetratricopeptide repeat protein [Duganella aceris]